MLPKWNSAVPMPKFALLFALSAPLSGLAEATPEEATIIASMSAVATRSASFFLNTSCVLLPQKGQGEYAPPLVDQRLQGSKHATTGATARWLLLGRTSENTPSTHSGE